MTTHRKERLAVTLRQQIARILEQHVADPRLRLLSVVEVRVTPDLSLARVFYRTLGDRDEASVALSRAASFVRRRLAEEVRMRRVPELEFRLDESPDRAARVEEILRELREEKP